jgi:hypothetical protein
MDCGDSSISRSYAMKFLFLGYLKKHIYALPPMTIVDFAVRLQAAVTPTCQGVKNAISWDVASCGFIIHRLVKYNLVFRTPGVYRIL